jgi:hypothetical protein
MLRASIEYSGRDAHLLGISEGEKAGDAGISHGERLTTFASAAVAGDVAELAAARVALRDAAGSGALVDAAAVVGNFQRMVRIADGTGIPLDGVTLALTSGLREDLGVEEYSSRRLGGSGGIVRVIGPALRRLASLGLRVAGRRSRRKSGQ